MKREIKVLLAVLMLASCKPMELKQLDLMKRGIVIQGPATTIRAELQDEGMLILPKMENTYYWFEKGNINSSQSAYSGKVLHGQFRVYDRTTKQVLESGKFRRGLKNGRWLLWNSTGLLKRSEIYNDGNLDGITINYDSLGKPADTLKYKNGALITKKASAIDTVGFISKVKRFFKKKK
jgi:hypothetical protein